MHSGYIICHIQEKKAGVKFMNIHKNIICVIVNCIVWFILVNSELSSIIIKGIDNGFVSDILPVAVVSALFSFIGRKSLREKLKDFIKTVIVSYICIVVIVMVCFMYAMYRFD